LLRQNAIDPVIIETNIDTVIELQATGRSAIYGDASNRAVLEAAGFTTATYLVVTVPNPEVCLSVVQTARELNPAVRIFARANYLNQQQILKEMGVFEVCYDEAEVARALAKSLLQEIQSPGVDLAIEDDFW